MQNHREVQKKKKKSFKIVIMEKGELQTARRTKQNQGPNQSAPVTTGPAHNSRLLVSKAILPVPNRACRSSLKAGYPSYSYLPGSCFCPPHIWVSHSLSKPPVLAGEAKQYPSTSPLTLGRWHPQRRRCQRHLGSVLIIFSSISRPVLHQAFIKKQE